MDTINLSNCRVINCTHRSGILKFAYRKHTEKRLYLAYWMCTCWFTMGNVKRCEKHACMLSTNHPIFQLVSLSPGKNGKNSKHAKINSRWHHAAFQFDVYFMSQFEIWTVVNFLRQCILPEKVRRVHLIWRPRKQQYWLSYCRAWLKLLMNSFRKLMWKKFRDLLRLHIESSLIVEDRTVE